MTACGRVWCDMASRYDNTYSRTIAWLKIVLPLLALLILSTLFLLARTVDPAQNLPFADVDVNELAEEQRLGRPNFAGVTQDGSAISLSANRASPQDGNPDSLSGEAVVAGIDLPTGERIDVVSGMVTIDNSAGMATLTDGVTLSASNGFDIWTDDVRISLEETLVASDSATTVTTPIGTLRADSFILTEDTRDEQNYVLVFNGHVKLIYEPGK